MFQFGVELLQCFFMLHDVGDVAGDTDQACRTIKYVTFYVMVLMLALGGGWSWPQAAGAAIVGLGVLVAQRN